MISVVQTFVQDHPATRGHFPAHPILPGAFLLDAAIRAICAQYGWSRERLVAESVKFPRPVSPGQSVSWELEEPVTKDTVKVVKFRGSAGGETVVSGILRFPC